MSDCGHVYHTRALREELRLARVTAKAGKFKKHNQDSHKKKKNIIDSLTKTKKLIAHTTNSMDEPTACTICHDDFSDGSELSVMSDCGHVYHARCINAYAASKTSNKNDMIACPNCRTGGVPVRLRVKVQRTTTEVGALVKETLELKSEVRAWTKRAQEGEDRAEGLKRQKDQVIGVAEKRLAEANESVRSAKILVGKAEREKAKSVEGSEALQERYEKVHAERNELQLIAERNRKNMEYLSTANKEQAEDIATLKEDLQKKASVVADLLDDLKTLQEHISTKEKESNRERTVMRKKEERRLSDDHKCSKAYGREKNSDSDVSRLIEMRGESMLTKSSSNGSSGGLSNIPRHKGLVLEMDLGRNTKPLKQTVFSQFVVSKPRV